MCSCLVGVRSMVRAAVAAGRGGGAGVQPSCIYAVNPAWLFFTAVLVLVMRHFPTPPCLGPEKS